MSQTESDVSPVFYLVCQPEAAYTKFAHQDFVLERVFAPSGRYFVPCTKQFDKYISIEALRAEIETVDFAALPKVEHD